MAGGSHGGMASLETMRAYTVIFPSSQAHIAWIMRRPERLLIIMPVAQFTALAFVPPHPQTRRVRIARVITIKYLALLGAICMLTRYHAFAVSRIADERLF